jgi:ribosome maturation factor RimP
LTNEEVVMDPVHGIREMVLPVVTAAGLEVWDVEAGAGLVRILVDRPGGIDLDALGVVTEKISAALDEHDGGPGGRYVLEVSSPGVERILRTPEQFRRFVGSLVSVKTAEAVEGSRRLRGMLLEADEAGITVAPEDRPGDARQAIPYDQIQRAHTVLVWGPAPKPGRPGAKSAARSGVSAPMKDAAQ